MFQVLILIVIDTVIFHDPVQSLLEPSHRLLSAQLQTADSIVNCLLFEKHSFSQT